MPAFNYTIRDEVGLHARPAGQLVNKVKSLGCKVTLKCGDRSADASRLFSVMALGIKCGDTVTVLVDGDEAAAAELEAFFESSL